MSAAEQPANRREAWIKNRMRHLGREPGWTTCERPRCFVCDNERDAYFAGVRDAYHSIRRLYPDPNESLTAREVCDRIDDLEHTST